jgi:predicted phosphoribosyltransferase
VDDGLATGATMHAAVRALRAQGPAAIVVAAPVAAPETCAALSGPADDCVCVLRPAALRGVGLWYEDFTQTGDAEVKELLERARAATAA